MTGANGPFPTQQSPEVLRLFSLGDNLKEEEWISHLNQKYLTLVFIYLTKCIPLRISFLSTLYLYSDSVCPTSSDKTSRIESETFAHAFTTGSWN
jgi:hypothetical protein